jgi:hypothetical protein
MQVARDVLGRFTYRQWTLTVEIFRFHLWQANTEHIPYGICKFPLILLHSTNTISEQLKTQESQDLILAPYIFLWISTVLSYISTHFIPGEGEGRGKNKQQ